MPHHCWLKKMEELHLLDEKLYDKQNMLSYEFGINKEKIVKLTHE